MKIVIICFMLIYCFIFGYCVMAQVTEENKRNSSLRFTNFGIDNAATSVFRIKAVMENDSVVYSPATRPAIR